jgi:uncharacterized protein involved in outer membrane biogenesis
MRSPWRLVGVGAAGFVSLGLLGLATLALFPWGVFKTRLADRLTRQIGAPVTIADMERLDRVSLHPVIRLRGVEIAQPAWAGPGKLATIGDARVRIGVLALITGGPAIETLDLSNARVALVRRKDGLENWTGRKGDGGKNASPAIERLTVRNTIVSYDDAKQSRGFLATLTVDPDQGLSLAGRGHIRGNPVSIGARGAPIRGDSTGRTWPFGAVIRGKSVGLRAAGTMDRPLDVGHLTARISAHGDDLVLLDAVIEAGLPATQPVKLLANVRRDGRDWTIRALTGSIGRSDLAGHGVIRKRDGRTRVDATLSARRFDFDDLASDEGLRIAAAKRARFGARLIPDTAIDLATVDKTDGRLKLRVGTLLWRGPSPLKTVESTLVLERSRLEVAPLSVPLDHGRIAGRVIVDQRGGSPVLTLTLDLLQARMLDFFPNAAIDGGLTGRVRLTGQGRTIRAAVGRSTGTIALYAHDGVIPARTASLLGQDVGRGLTTDKDKQAVLRCMVARFDVRGGRANTAPVMIDTSRALTRATGTISLADERLALMLSGAPKRESLLRLPGSIPIAGTIKAPDIRVPKQAKSLGGVLGMIGRAVSGKQGDTADDADCGALQRQAMG